MLVTRPRSSCPKVRLTGFAPEGLPLDSLVVEFALGSPTKLGSIAGAATPSALTEALTPALRRGGRKSEIPFGPYMIAAALLAIFVANPIANWYLDLVHH